MTSITKFIHIGCCGFPVAKSKYYNLFDCVEIQQTFYQPPPIDTLKKWRKEAPKDFIFTIKAWQALTHRSSSPTWKRIDKKKIKGNIKNYGDLRPTEENFYAWEVTLEAAKALDAKIIVVQTPPSFSCTDENIKNMKDFFSSVKRDGLLIGWEPRGDWLDRPGIIKELVEELNLLHIVDLLKTRPATTSMGILYTRLHGLGKGYVNYSYKYTDEDLHQLKEIIGELSRNSRIEECYVMFNNKYMLDDALRFKKILVA